MALFTAQLLDGAGAVVASGVLDIPIVDPPSGAFPKEYSLSRPLLVNNQGALVTGEDWQDMNSTQDVLDLPGRGGKFFFHINGADPGVTGYVTLTTDDPTFTKVVKCLQGDGSDALHPGTTAAKRDFPGISRAWYRFTMKFQPGFTNDGPGDKAPSWKVMFGGAQRNYEFLGADPVWGYVTMDATRPGYGGSDSLLPNSDRNHGISSTEYTDGEWWEFIVYEERVSSTHYRVRRWRRQLTTNGVITGPTSSARWARLFGSEVTGASVPANDSNTIRLGINRNRFMFPGKQQHWFWGPWEVIDGDVVADPYGIASQIV